MVSSLRVDMSAERDDVTALFEPLGSIFISSGMGLGGWDMALDYPGWEIFVNGDDNHSTLTASPAGRMESDPPTFHHTCTTG